MRIVIAVAVLCSAAPALAADPPAAAAEDVTVQDGSIWRGTGADPSVPPAPEAAEYATRGYTKPEQADRTCVRDAIRIPRLLEGFEGTVTVKFAVRRDGSVDRFSVLSIAPDEIGEAIRQAVEGCRWIPGRDPQGRLVSIWVIVPVRFTEGSPPPPPPGSAPGTAPDAPASR